MNLKEVLAWLLSNEYIVIVSGQVVFTKKCADELNNLGFSTRIAEDINLSTPTVSTPVQTPLVTDKKAVWNKFIEDAKIPHRVRAPDGGIYTVRQYSPGVATKLAKIIADPSVDYTRLIESTNHYYHTVTYKALLSNYIDKEIWRSEYDAWDNKPKITNVSENRWED